MDVARSFPLQHGFLGGGGEAAALIAARDWSDTPLGPIENWPPCLKTTLGILLRSPVPMVLLWGEDGIMLYNDAYSAFAGRRHPELLGSKVREGWPEVAAFNDHVMKVGLAGGTLAYRDQELTLHRDGVPEQVWMNLDYSPVPDASGHPAGVIAIVVETTEALLARRRADEERQRLATMFSQAPGLIAMLEGPDHVFRLANPGYLQLVGGRDLIGKPAREALPELEGQGHFPLLDEVYRTGRAFVGTAVPAELVRETGGTPEKRFYDFVYQPLTDSSGNVSGIFAEGQDVTERVLAEDKLRRSEERFRALVSTSSQSIYSMNADWSEMRQLDGSGLLIGSEAPNRNWLAEYIPADEKENVLAAIRDAVAHQKMFELEHRVIRADGSIGWVDSRAIPVPDDAGEVVEWFGAVSDATARKQAEERLRASETRLRLAIESGQIGEWELDLATDTAVRAQRHDQIFGYSEPVEDWGFERFIGHVLAEDRPHVEAAFKKAAETGGGWHFECRIRRVDDGQIRWIAAHSTPQLGEDGRAMRLFGLVQDITDQRQAEEDVRLGADRIRRLLDQLYVFVGVVSPEGILLEANRAPLEAAGIKAEDVIGKPFWEAYWWSYDPAVQGRLRQAVQQAAAGEVVRYDVPVRMAGGALVTIDFQLAPMRDAEGRLTHLIPSGTIVEERIRAQAELKKLNETLEQRVEAAVAELSRAEDALRQSQKLESMGQLTGGVAHDFNNLLTPIIGSLDLLQRSGLKDERTQRLVDGALQAADRAKTLVQRLLAFARRQPLQPTSVDLVRLVEGMADLVASTSGPRVRLKVDLPDNLPAVSADPNQLEMAILNLAVNARDAMADGGQLSIAATAETGQRMLPAQVAPGHYVRLSVADTGRGMDEATLARAIEPFFSTKGIGKGTGLGLSMVHGLAAQLGGALTIQSRLGLGTNVELWLPVAEEPSAEPEQRTEVNGPQAAGTALLIDDEELVRMSTADMLSDLGYDVVEARSAEEALKQVEEGLQFDLLVTDHLMPGMTGTELAREVRQRRPAMPVLIISGYAEAEGIAPDLPRLTKPFRRAELAASIAGLLSTTAHHAGHGTSS